MPRLSHEVPHRALGILLLLTATGELHAALSHSIDCTFNIYTTEEGVLVSVKCPRVVACLKYSVSKYIAAGAEYPANASDAVARTASYRRSSRLCLSPKWVGRRILPRVSF